MYGRDRTLVSVAIMAMAPGTSAARVARITPNASLTWVRLHPQTSPPADSGAPMAFVPPTGQVVLFGRARPGSRFGDTWMWDGSNWNRALPATSPPDRAYARAVLDSTIGQGELFGGLKDGASLT